MDVTGNSHVAETNGSTATCGSATGGSPNSRVPTVGTGDAATLRHQLLTWTPATQLYVQHGHSQRISCVRIPLMGRCGSGISSVINTILRAMGKLPIATEYDCGSQGTFLLEDISVTPSITLVDSPGFFADSSEEVKRAQEILSGAVKSGSFLRGSSPNQSHNNDTDTSDMLGDCSARAPSMIWVISASDPRSEMNPRFFVQRMVEWTLHHGIRSTVVITHIDTVPKERQEHLRSFLESTYRSERIFSIDNHIQNPETEMLALQILHSVVCNTEIYLSVHPPPIPTKLLVIEVGHEGKLFKYRLPENTRCQDIRTLVSRRIGVDPEALAILTIEGIECLEDQKVNEGEPRFIVIRHDAYPPERPEMRLNIPAMKNEIASYQNRCLDLEQQSSVLKAENAILRSEKEELESISRSCLLLDVNDFIDPSLLSCGSFGAVFFARHPRIQIPLCLKFMMDVNATINPSPTLLRNSYRNEVQCLSILPSHPNILHPICTFFATLPDSWVQQIAARYPVYAEWSIQRSVMIMMPHGGVPFDKVFSTVVSSKKDVLLLLQQALSATCHLANNFTVHRDIKGDNLLIKSTSQGHRIYVIDFGLAIVTKFNEQMTYPIDLNRDSPWGNSFTYPPNIAALTLSANRGLRSNSNIVKVPYKNADSFAIALVFWQLMCADPQALTNTSQSTFNPDKLPPLRPELSGGAMERTLRAMLLPSCDQRMSASQALDSLLKADPSDY
ncbi:hypothetical protein Pelo_1672 [Pelomyxa schiedti]|nr:hypothetical protein Pelo_1672 [Pelomyxa schiedti]